MLHRSWDAGMVRGIHSYSFYSFSKIMMIKLELSVFKTCGISLTSAVLNIIWVDFTSGCIITIHTWCVFFGKTQRNIHTLVLRSWLCSLLVSVAAYGKLLLEDDGSLSLSLSLSPNQEKGMQVWMDDIESAGERFPPDSSSNSADPLMMVKRQNTCNQSIF